MRGVCALFAVLVLAGVSGCGSNEPKTPGQAVDKAIEKSGDTMKKAGEELKKAGEEVKKEVQK